MVLCSFPATIIAIGALVGLIVAAVKKQITSSRYKYWTYQTLAMSLVLPAIIVSYRSNPNRLPPGSSQMQFEVEIWKDFSSIRSNYEVYNLSKRASLRQKMLNDLVENHLQLMTINNFEEVLGLSDEGYGSCAKSETPVYILGSERTADLIVGYEVLLIKFDENGDFESYEICNG